jgi:hypothetical protein
MPKDINSISEWVRGGTVRSSSTAEPQSEAWEKFLRAVHRLELGRRYILITSPIEHADFLSSISKIPWTGAIDFDPNSDTSGLLKSIRPLLEMHRSLHQLVAGDRPSISPDTAVYWFYSRGLTGRDDTLQVGLWRDCAKRYSLELREQLQNLASSISPAATTCIVLWYQNDLTRHLQSTLEIALGAFGDALDVVIISDDPAALGSVAAESGATLVDIPLHQLC